MSRLPIRTRLTGAFVLAMMVVLLAAGAFVYARVGADLDEGIDEALAARADAVAALATRGQADAATADSASREDASEGFAQVIAADGRVIDAAGRARAPATSPDALPVLAAGASPVDRRVPGVDGGGRVLVERLPRPRTGTRATAAADRFVVVGQSLEDRDEALSELVTAFTVGGPLAVVLAGLLGYLLAGAALRPIESMRRRAEALSLEDADRRLPVPAADDEVRRLGETLNDMLGRLRRSFERERRFVADASHELRTPIAVIKMELESALRAESRGAGAREALVAAVEECDRLAQMAQDLLVISRAADGRLPVRPEPLDAAEVLGAVRDRFADRAREQGRGVSVDARSGLTLRADPLRLRQALGNLVDNALRHGEGEIVLGARAQGSGAELEVADRGPGFAPGVRDRAFERFSRGDEARSGGGAGLGLAIVRAIADAHDGEVAIAAGPHGVVRLWLPSRVEGTPAVAGTAWVDEARTPAREGAAGSHPDLSQVP